MILLIKLVIHTTNYMTINISPQSIENVFVLITKVKWDGFIKTIIFLKLLFPITLVLAKQSGLPLD